MILLYWKKDMALWECPAGPVFMKGIILCRTEAIHHVSIPAVQSWCLMVESIVATMRYCIVVIEIVVADAGTTVNGKRQEPDTL